jgi:prepilin signal peptidase PulO-like enzyme (type II secretory pathway)
MQIGFIVLMTVLGAAIGSFLCCQARRLHYREKTKKSLGPRSVCMKCKHQLKWYENIPIISWVIQGGKCRKCHTKIGCGEIFSELGVAIMFLCIATTIDISVATPQEWCIFGTTLILSIVLAFLAIHDGLYGELPTSILILAIILSAGVFVAKNWQQLATVSVWTDLVIAFAILGGLYFVLSLVPREWVGDGDWLVATAIAIALGSPWLALFVLFLSNFIASVTMYPFVKGKKKKQIYFGPFLVIAYIIVITFSFLIESMVVY